MATLTRSGQVLIFDDVPVTRNPRRKHVDWARDIAGVPVDNPRGGDEYSLQPGQELVLFDGTRTLTANSSTEYALALSALAPDRYRLTWTGVGAAPGFRADRALALSGGTATVTLLANQTVTLTSSLGAVFGAVQLGDVVLIPGTSTGDSALFDPLNEGEWTVLGVTTSQLTLARVPGAVFSGATETVAVTTNLQVQAYAAAGVAEGDTLDLTAGFSSVILRAYRILAATSKYLEFSSSLPLVAQTAVPGTAGLKVYSSAKRYLALETDQEIAVKLNGNAAETDRVEPWVAGDAGLVGWFEKTGITYALSVKNRSTRTCKVLLITAE